ncbi:MAG: hypothetical protein WAU77_13315 [Solirubrobacteraceae bacterium]
MSDIGYDKPASEGGPLNGRIGEVIWRFLPENVCDDPFPGPPRD